MADRSWPDAGLTAIQNAETMAHNARIDLSFFL
jgi:hypothetical protein